MSAAILPFRRPPQAPAVATASALSPLLAVSKAQRQAFRQGMLSAQDGAGPIPMFEDVDVVSFRRGYRLAQVLIDQRRVAPLIAVLPRRGVRLDWRIRFPRLAATLTPAVRP